MLLLSKAKNMLYYCTWTFQSVFRSSRFAVALPCCIAQAWPLAHPPKNAMLLGGGRGTRQVNDLSSRPGNFWVVDWKICG